MIRDRKSAQEQEPEISCGNNNSYVREQTAWSRREFLANSAGLAAAGAIGGLAATHPLSAHEMTARVSASKFAMHSPAAGKPRRIIIDTDPGIDDAMAIFLALRSPELTVEAITPVCGNVPLDLTLPNALRMVEIAGRTDIPVAAGARAPLLRRLVTASYVHGENGLGGAFFPEPRIKPVATLASEMIRQII